MNIVGLHVVLLMLITQLVFSKLRAEMQYSIAAQWASAANSKKCKKYGLYVIFYCMSTKTLSDTYYEVCSFAFAPGCRNLH